MKLMFISICAFILGPFAHGITIQNKELKDKISMNGKDLVLNGAGIRKATIFNVKVYVAGLYTTSKSKDGNSIIKSETPKYITMHFLRNVDKEKITGAWDEAFENNKSINAEYKAELAKLNGLMRDMKKNSSMSFWMEKDLIKVIFDQKEVGQIKGKAIDKLLLAAWLGNPIDKQLKEGLLGN